MFDEAHPIPLTCPKHSCKFDKSIGWLKNNDSFSCPVCGFIIEFESRAFVDSLNHFQQTFTSEGVTSGLIHKPSQLS